MQRSCYSGHNSMNFLIYQSVTKPDGMIFSLFGTEIGSRNYLSVIRSSGIEEILENCLNVDRVQHYIVADNAYVLQPFFQVVVLSKPIKIQ